MLEDEVACVDIGPRWMLEPKEAKLWQAGFPCEIRELPGFIGLYINLRHELPYRLIRPLG